MISIKKAREILGDKYKNLSDEEIEKIRDEVYQLANLVFDSWLKKKQSEKRNKEKPRI